MAVSLAPAAAPAPSASLLASLRAFTRALETRRALQQELDSAMSSFFSPTSTSTQLDWSVPDALASSTSHTHPTPAAGQSQCAAEAANPRAPNEEELNEVLKIAFGGLLEVKEEIRLLREEINEKWERRDLEKVVRKIEQAESERVKATLELYQLRRLMSLDSSLSPSLIGSIQEKESSRTTLAQQVQEELQEITAEIAELSLAEEDAKERGESATAVKA
ncbi:hypothetical protein JCM11641_006871 [Rhodosporidiobolus odoratus]